MVVFSEYQWLIKTAQNKTEKDNKTTKKSSSQEVLFPSFYFSILRFPLKKSSLISFQYVSAQAFFFLLPKRPPFCCFYFHVTVCIFSFLSLSFLHHLSLSLFRNEWMMAMTRTFWVLYLQKKKEVFFLHSYRIHSLFTIIQSLTEIQN